MLSLALTETSLPSLHRPLLLTTLAGGPFSFLDVTWGTGEGVEIEVEIGVGIGVEREVGDIVQGPDTEGNLILLRLVDRDEDRGIIPDQGVNHGHALGQEGENQNHRNPGEGIRKGTVDLDLDLCQV